MLSLHLRSHDTLIPNLQTFFGLSQSFLWAPMGFMEKKPAEGYSPLQPLPWGPHPLASASLHQVHPSPSWTCLPVPCFILQMQKSQPKFHLRKGEREKGRGRVERERERNTLNFFLLVPVLTLQENDLIGYFKSTVHLKTNEPGGGRDDYRLWKGLSHNNYVCEWKGMHVGTVHRTAVRSWADATVGTRSFKNMSKHFWFPLRWREMERTLLPNADEKTARQAVTSSFSWALLFLPIGMMAKQPGSSGVWSHYVEGRMALFFCPRHIQSKDTGSFWTPVSLWLCLSNGCIYCPMYLCSRLPFLHQS